MIEDTLIDAPPVNPLHDRMAMARAAGYEWDEINAQVSGRQQAAYAAGYHPADVERILGYPDSSPLHHDLRTQMRLGRHG